jgi:uncharacterized protein YihD (DUF1040 family)
MRDPQRIDRILEQLEIAWKKSPDLRLGQLLINVAGYGGAKVENNLFYYEDDSFERDLEIWNERIK